RVTGLCPYVLGAMVGRQLPFFSLIVPFWLIWAFAGWRGMIQIWPAILVCGVSFAIPQFLISNFINPWIVDIGASLISMACLIVAHLHGFGHAHRRHLVGFPDGHQSDPPRHRDSHSRARGSSIPSLARCWAGSGWPSTAPIPGPTFFSATCRK